MVGATPYVAPPNPDGTFKRAKQFISSAAAAAKAVVEPAPAVGPATPLAKVFDVWVQELEAAAQPQQPPLSPPQLAGHGTAGAGIDWADI